VDAKALRFIQRDARSIQQLTFTTVLETSSGEFLDGKQAIMDLDLGLATLAEFEAKGIQATAQLPPPTRRMADSPSHSGSRGQRIGAWTLVPEAQ